mmetsp:Transcript_16320/g.33144  ORF Transcript_16320/g.33144 Transcript_16320/m.33144 type:complete len:93 (+) Transcript_16320:543-821(+)
MSGSKQGSTQTRSLSEQSSALFVKAPVFFFSSLLLHLPALSSKPIQSHPHFQQEGFPPVYPLSTSFLEENRREYNAGDALMNEGFPYPPFAL